MNEIELSREFRNEGSYSLIERDTRDEQAVEMWLKRHSSENTRQQYARVARRFLGFVGKDLQQVTLADMQAWQASLNGAINTRRVYVRALQSLYSFLHKVGYINMNPGVMLIAEKQKATQHMKVLTEEQVIRMIGADISKRDEAIVRVLYSSSMRVTELCELVWSDVIEDGDKAVLVIRGKGDSTRKSGISAAAYAAMKQLRGDAKDGDPVFVSNRKRKMYRTTVNYLFRKLRGVAGRDVSPHWMRHSHITHALKRMANPVDVMHQAGHSSLAITTGYAHGDKFSSDALIA